MKYLIFILFLFGCSESVIEELKIIDPINGTFESDNITLVFEDGIISGNTKCNSLGGDYYIFNNEITINIGGTKVFCNDEFNIKHIRESYSFTVTNETLILIGSDYQLKFTKTK